MNLKNKEHECFSGTYEHHECECSCGKIACSCECDDWFFDGNGNALCDECQNEGYEEEEEEEEED